MEILVWESYLTLRTKQNSSTQPILLSCYSHNVLNSVCYVWTLIWGLCASCMKHFPKCSLNTPLQKKCLSHNLTNKICAFILCERIWEVVLHQVIMVATAPITPDQLIHKHKWKIWTNKNLLNVIFQIHNTIFDVLYMTVFGQTFELPPTQHFKKGTSHMTEDGHISNCLNKTIRYMAVFGHIKNA